MKIIRHNCFETNSSSTHSLCLVDTEMFNKWQNGEKIWFNRYENTFISKEDIIEIVKDKNNISEINEDTYEYLSDYIQHIEYNGCYLYEDYDQYEILSEDAGNGKTAMSIYGYD